MNEKTVFLLRITMYAMSDIMIIGKSFIQVFCHHVKLRSTSTLYGLSI
jgi:hypothetical protein